MDEGIEDVPEGGLDREELDLTSDNRMVIAAAIPLSVQLDDLPTKVLNSASYTQITNPPPRLRPSPDEGSIPWLDFGLMYLYRSLFFDKGLVTGSFEQILSIAPGETIEVGIEISKRSTLEEENEAKFQVTSSSEASSSLTSEFTDRVSTVIQTTNSSSASMSASGGIGVFNVGASGSATYSSTRTDSTEKMKRTVNESTQRVSQEIMKSQVFRTRRTEEVTSKDYYRRLIVNNTETLSHYGLRRLQQRYSVSSQLRGPRLVWQFAVYDPGKRIATPRILTEDIIPSPLLQAGARDIRYAIIEGLTVTIDGTVQDPGVAWIRRLYISPEFRILSMQFENGWDRISITQNGQDAGQPWEYTALLRLIDYKPVTNSPGSYDVAFQMARTSAAGPVPKQMRVTFPRVQALMLDQNLEAIWHNNPNTVSEFLPKYRKLLADTRAIKPRPAGDLRREERDEVVSRAFEVLSLTDTVFSPTDVLSMPRLFDIEATFYHLIPPFVQSATDQYGSGNAWAREYDALADADPAPLGSSIGWKIQPDGDARRNEFINSSLARVSIPIQKKMEREAIAFLKDRLGADVSPTVDALVTDLETRWGRESYADTRNIKESQVPFNVITPPFDEKTAPDNRLAQALYPIVDIFAVNEPTQGFVYTPLQLP
jgi:hypothetical protein